LAVLSIGFQLKELHTVRILGVLIFIVGIILLFSNVSRLFPTFPFAGYIGIALGGVLFRVGGSA